MGFERVVGHHRPKKLIASMIAAQRLAHALLLTGPAGVGKYTLALNVAQAANCTAPAEERPCGVCNSCRKIERGVHPDVREYEPEGKLRVIKIDTIRELRKETTFKPFEGRTKVFIVREADRMQVQGDSAANALLKTLEEPPPDSLLILTAPNESDLLPTIISRCARLHLAPLALPLVEQWLAEQRGLSGPQARLVAVLAEGCLGRVAQVDPEEVWQLRDSVVDHLEELDRGDLEAGLDWAAELAKDPGRWPLVLRLTRFYFRDLMIMAGARGEGRLINEDLAPRLAAQAARRPVQAYIQALTELDQAEDSLNRLIRPDLVFENLVLRLTARHPQGR